MHFVNRGKKLKKKKKKTKTKIVYLTIYVFINFNDVLNLFTIDLHTFVFVIRVLYI